MSDWAHHPTLPVWVIEKDIRVQGWVLPGRTVRTDMQKLYT